MGLHKHNGSFPTSIDQFLLVFDFASFRIGSTGFSYSFLVIENFWALFYGLFLYRIGCSKNEVSPWLSVLYRAKIGW